MKMDTKFKCPQCGHEKVEQMSTEWCQFMYRCEGCQALITTPAGECCVFCAYGDTKCPEQQQKDKAVV